jgi:uncharacterized protein (TIGR03435 family)
MAELNDHQLLAEYACRGSEEAFAALVNRYVNLVYSTGLRCTGNAQHAEEIVQAVFIILARKAGKLSCRVSVPGWLYQTARLTAANLNKKEHRRVRREQDAYMQSTLNEARPAAWEKIAPLLDEAMGRLGATDRQVVMLRYFENRSAAEIGAELRMTEESARQRAGRALEKLRKYFGKRGAVLSAGAIASAVLANSVQAAPAGVAKAASAVAVAKGVAASASTLALVKAALSVMTWTKMKMAGLGITVALATVTTTAVVINWDLNSAALAKNPPVLILRPTGLTNGTGGVTIGTEKNYRMMLQNQSMRLLLAQAFHGEQYREVLPEGLPQGNYDFMYTLPGVSYGWVDGLRAELKRQFGVTAHFETRVTRVLLLEAPGLDTNLVKVASTHENTCDGNWRNVVFRAAPMDMLARWMEAVQKTPVLDRTGLTNRYDTAIQWMPVPGQSEAAAIDEALRTRYGFQFIETNLPLRVLVVESHPPNGHASPSRP